MTPSPGADASRRRRMRVRAWATLALLAALPLPAAAASRFDPARRFRTLPTEHFVIYFHQRGDVVAQRLAAIAEETWRTLQQPLGVQPPRRTHVVLTDQTDLANGYATPLPYNTIVIYTVGPAGTDFAFDDWLRLVFTHEFTHIVHLDRSEHWARVARSMFGRTALAFPNLFLPAWQIEGLATYEESIVTGTGRLHAGDFAAIVGEAARRGRLEPLDRANGGLTDWPGGTVVYAYGVGFHQYLADRYGSGTLATLATATARRLPYTASRVFKRIYGQPLGTLWREYEAHVAATAKPAQDAGTTPAPKRITHHGFNVRGPRFDRFACEGCPADILYSASNPDGFPALYRIEAAGGAPQRLTTRYLGSTVGIGRDVVYFDQLEVRRNTGLYSDLYAWSRSSGKVRPLTREARLISPDLSPDGKTIACVQDHDGQRDLVLVDPATVARNSARDGSLPRAGITTLIAERETQFDAPRWSPDGRLIAAERHRLGAMPEIVVVDVATQAVRVVASDRDIRFVTPAWRPDGATIVAAAAPADDTFNLVELTLGDGSRRQLTQTTGGATWPDVSPDGTTIAFAGYTADGYDVFTTPYPASPQVLDQTTDVGADVRRTRVAPESTAARSPDAAYSPLPTLKPTSWSPIVESDADQVRLGASTGGADVLGYHAYAVSATWLVSGPAAAAKPRAVSPDWQAYYTYDRWRPRLFVSASTETAFFAGPPSDTGAPTAATRRTRQVESGVVVPFSHTRNQHLAFLSIARSADDFTLADDFLTRRRTPLRAAWETVTAHRYGYSISPEAGVAAGATAELVRSAFGSFADATTITADGRAFLPGITTHHVVAVRASGGASFGNVVAGRTFLLGGNSPAADVVDFGSSASSLLRGFPANTFAGTRVALINAEYRWPIARPQRGVGTWPIFLHSLHGAVFADLGHAWTQTFDRAAVKTSLGAQLSADVVAGYFAPLTMNVGAAFGHDGSARIGDRITVYFSVGKAF